MIDTLRMVYRKLPGLIPDLLQNVPLLPKIARNYAYLAAGRKRLRTVDFALTFDCQCNCDHCYAGPMTRTDETPMTFEEMRSAIDQSLALGALTINFVGGEPLCHPRVVDLVASIPRHRGLPMLTTNGVGLTEDIVRRLAAAGLAYVAVSLDYDDRKRHDRFRKRAGTWESAMAGLERARAAGIGVIVNTTVTADNLDDGTVDRLADFAGRIGARITLGIAASVGNWESNGGGALTPEQRRHVDDLLRRPQVRWDGSTNYLREGCAAGTEKLNITAYGDVLPCALIHVGFGNVKREPLESIWRRMMSEPRFGHIAPKCIAVDDRSFVDQVMREVNRHVQRPVPADTLFGAEQKQPGRAGPGD